jgi:acyl transferase domain-containing protein/acyl carrier protein
MTRKPAEPVAIVGMACRFPGAPNIDAFWDLLARGGDAIRQVPADRWNADRFYHPDPQVPGAIASSWGGFVDNADRFDAAFFDIAPREAARIDPQHRWLAEVAFEAVEDAGLDIRALVGTRTGVFIGISQSDYPQLNRSELDLIDGYSNIGSALSLAANRLSYLFDLQGPSFAVDTACSSSMTALHLAMCSLRSRECDVALVGGASALLSPGPSIGFSQAQMLSPRGRCRAFDASADGYVRAEGAAVVLLMPPAHAKAQGLQPRALILATAANQDGRSSGLTVPNGAAQEAMIRGALAEAGADPRDVGYAEAHGTGTPIGDPIEANALANVLGKGRAVGERLLIGSVKTNIGHLEPASGIAGLIKAALAIERGAIPPHLHVHTPNPRLPLERIQLPDRLMPLPDGALVAVNSFGFGGANAHALLGPAPPVEPRLARRDAPWIVPLSARSCAALADYGAAYADLLECDPDVSVGAFAASAALGKSHLTLRDAVVANDRASLIDRLRSPREPAQLAVPARMAFVFSGQGSQWWAMGRQLYQEEPVVRAMWQQCHEACVRLGGPDLLAALLADEADSALNRTDLAQPALFALQAGIAELWRSWGVVPSAVIGHSVGEAAAAWAAGLFDLDGIFRIILARSRAQHRTHRQGRMLAAALDEAAGRAWETRLPERVWLAALNAPRQITLAGEAAALAEVAAELDSQGLFNRLLPTEYAFHSGQMDPVEHELRTMLAELSGGTGTLPMISSVTASRLDGISANTDYWWRNIREPVRFAAGIETLLAEGCNLFIEIGPHPVLSGAVRETIAAKRGEAIAMPTLRRGEDERQMMLDALARLYRNGVDPDWRALYQRPSPPLRLPAYPWQRQRFWSEAQDTQQVLRGAPPHPLLGDRDPGPTPRWSGRIDMRAVPWLADHRVLGATVFPGAAYLEMASAAVRELMGGDAPVVLEDVRFHRLLMLPERGGVRTSVEIDAKAATFRIHAATPAWELKAEGRYRTARFRRPPNGNPAALATALPETRNPAELYQALDAMGQDYGPAFRAIDALRVGGEEQALSRVVLRGERGRGDYGLFPPMLDACFHSCIAVQRGEQRAFVVTGIARLRSYAPLPDAFWSHFQVVERNENAYVGDLTIFDDVGAVLARIDGLQLRTLQSETGSRATDRVHRLEWEPVSAATESLLRDPVVIFADASGVGEAAAALLRERLLSAITIHRAQIDRGSADWAAKLWSSLPASRAVLYCWGCDGGDALAQSADLLSLAQADTARARWAVVTRGGQAVGPNPCDPAQAALWGLVRTMQTEAPTWPITLVDLDQHDPGAMAVAELLADDAEREVAWRNGARLGHRLREMVRAPSKTRSRPPAFHFVVGQPGRIDSLECVGFALPAPGSDEIEVEITAAGVNFRDLMKLLGIYPLAAGEPPSLGDEFTGRVRRIGNNVRRLRPGDRVSGIAAGAFSSHLILPAQAVWPTRETLSDAEAATTPIVFGTAFHALQTLARLRRGESVLIHAGAGGVGLAAIQLAQKLGARVLATAGSEAKRAFLQSLGIERVMDSRTLDFADEVMRHTDGRGVDVVVNSLAGDFLRASLGVCAPGGRFVEIGKRDLFEDGQLPLGMFRRSLALFAFDLGAVLQAGGFDARAVRRFVIRGDHAALPCRTFPVTEAQAAFRTMQSAEHIGKLAIDFTTPPPELPAEYWPRADATYLVTGGTRGFGLEVAKWLVGRGARHLLLISRSGAIAPEALAGLHRTGALVRVEAADVADAAALDFLRDLSPELGGVFHCAMQLADASIAAMTAANLSSAFGPKATGALNLHRATLGMRLDAFVLFSSISGIIGAPGQANYAAANSFLDALAAQRRAAGQVGLSVAWGQIGEVGIAADRKQIARYLETIGVRAIPPARALEALASLIVSGEVQPAMIDVDWHKLARASPKFAASPIFRDLVSSNDEAAKDNSADAWRAMLLALPDEERAGAVAKMVVAQIAATLGLDPRDVQPARPLAGLDSLMAVELMVRIEEQAGCDLPIAALNAEATLALLAQRVLAAIHAEDQALALPRLTTSAETPTFAAPFVSQSSRPLADLIADGSLPPLTAAALMPWPAAWFERVGLAPGPFFAGLNGTRVSLDLIIETQLGSLGLFMLPLTTTQVIPGSATLMPHLIDGVAQASGCGAGCVALTGLIPSATNYGVTLAEACRNGRASVTTGHATTIASVVLNLAALLAEAERDIAQETVMAYGIGSIGLGALRLMLDTLAHPAGLDLCDPFRDPTFFARLEASLRQEHGFTGRIRVVRARDPIEAGVIVGATNVGDVLAIDDLLPGTLVIDDSAPHCMNAEAAFARFEARGDLLFTEGGFVRAPVAMPRTVHLPDGLTTTMQTEIPQQLFSMLTPNEITGCVLSALISATHADLPPRVGIVAPGEAARHLQALRDLGFSAAPLTYEGIALNPAGIAAFHARSPLAAAS